MSNQRKRRKGPSKFQRALDQKDREQARRTREFAPKTRPRPTSKSSEKIQPKKGNMTYVVYLVIVIAVGAGVIGVLAINKDQQTGDDNSVQSTDVSDIIPKENEGDTGQTTQGDYGIPYTVTSCYGETIPLSQYQGKILVMMFWGTRCPACEIQTPRLVNVYNEFKKGGQVEIVSLEVQGASSDTLIQWGESNMVMWKNCPDTGVKIASHYSIASIPTTIIFDENGGELQRFIGAQTEETLTNAINAALA